jgi:hypothetical protein
LAKFRSATETAPLPFTSPSSTRKETAADASVPPWLSLTFVRAKVTCWALATPARGIDIVWPEKVAGPETVAVPAETAAEPAVTGRSNATTITRPPVRDRHSIPPAPLCGRGRSKFSAP